MRKCIKCLITKEDTSFNIRSGKPHLRSNICKECTLKTLKEHRQHIRKVVNRWKEIKGCYVCGFKGKHYQLDLDHNNPNTKHSSGNHRAYEPNWKMERVKKELAKCTILCANCHREKTFLNSDHLQVCDSPAHDENYI